LIRAETPDRLSAFSDGVFTVLITILVLDLRPPEIPSFRALLESETRPRGISSSSSTASAATPITRTPCSTTAWSK